ncbi:hypothetical protein D9757_006033 [Collybiopsis confluens]|uniref:Uncharacterized protein n=1 Tax=Collybiopsis confluens TaxID=2823264 RepID=A0A8H5HUQ4_9AGAR|nr:hypothetical protein D9757_006033 [Collybiopsis confluens]
MAAPAVHIAAEQAELVQQQINSVTTMLDSFNAQSASLMVEPERVVSRPFSTIQMQMLRSHRIPLGRPVLPVEIIEYVLRSVHDNDDLLSVALSNRHMHAVAVRVIYQSITLSRPRQSIQCLLALAHQPSLASLVRSLSFQWQSFSHLTHNTYRLTLRALCSTLHLSSLTIDAPSDFHPWNLSICTFKLKSFSASFPCDNLLIQFLESQPTLIDLTLRGFNSDPLDFQFTLSTFNLNPNPLPFPLSPNALPNLARLRAIHAGPDIMETIIRGRPLKQISMPLYADCVGRSLDVLKMGCAEGGVERLNIISFDPNAPVYLLEEIARRVPGLEALHVVILLAHCSDALLEGLTPSLKKFKALQYLTYMSATSDSDSSDPDPPPPDLQPSSSPSSTAAAVSSTSLLTSSSQRLSPTAIEQNIATMWHQSCPTLKTVILPRGKVWFLDNQKWMCLEDTADGKK